MKNRNLTDEDRSIIKRYGKIPDLQPDDNYGLGVGLGVGAFLFVALGLILLLGSHVENTKDGLARDIIEIRDGEHTCKQLERQLAQTLSFGSGVYLKSELYDRLEKDDCMTHGEIKEHKRGDHCKKYDTIECRIDAIKNPQEQIVNRRGN